MNWPLGAGAQVHHVESFFDRGPDTVTFHSEI